jgi:hypothetical protein
MHDHASPAAPAADSGTAGPTSIFLSWSGPDSRSISMAFKELLEAVGGTRVKPFHSDEIESPDPWRDQIKRAVARSDVAVLCLVPASLRSTWLMYEAGAFFDGGDTYLLACGVDAPRLTDTPLDAFNLKDACNRKSVRGLARLLALPKGAEAGAVDPAFDRAFDLAWPSFDRVVTRIRRKQVWKRLVWRAAPPLAALLLAAVWWFQVPLQCAVRHGASCSDLRWAAFVDAEKTATNKDFDKKVSRRPFAVVAVGGSCAPGSIVPWARLIGPNAVIAAGPVPVIFARSNYDQNEKVAAAVVLGNDQASTLLDTPCHDLPGAQSIHVPYIGTLSDDKFCDRVQQFDQYFDSRRTLATELAGFLQTLKVSADPVERLDTWLAHCGVPERPGKPATVGNVTSPQASQ